MDVEEGGTKKRRAQRDGGGGCTPLKWRFALAFIRLGLARFGRFRKPIPSALLKGTGAVNASLHTVLRRRRHPR